MWEDCSLTKLTPVQVKLRLERANALAPLSSLVWPFVHICFPLCSVLLSFWLALHILKGVHTCRHFYMEPEGDTLHCVSGACRSLLLEVPSPRSLVHGSVCSVWFWIITVHKAGTQACYLKETWVRVAAACPRASSERSVILRSHRTQCFLKTVANLQKQQKFIFSQFWAESEVSVGRAVLPKYPGEKPSCRPLCLWLQGPFVGHTSSVCLRPFTWSSLCVLSSLLSLMRTPVVRVR